MLSGTPMEYPSGGQAMVYRVQPRPRAVTRNTRENTFGSFLVGYGQPANAAPLPAGHDQHLFAARHAAANLQWGGGLAIIVAARQGRNLGRQLNLLQQQQNGPAVCSNGRNACFAAASIAFLTATEVTYCFSR
jgi:hypothetical protein